MSPINRAMTGFDSELFSGPLCLSFRPVYVILMEKRYFLYHVATFTETTKAFEISQSGFAI